MRFPLLLLLTLSASASWAQGTAVRLLNAGPTDVAVERPDKTIELELAPGAAGQTILRKSQWLKMGQEVYLFDTRALQRQAARGGPIVLQVGPGSFLYVLSPSANKPEKIPPKQPRGFPLRPIKKVDLT
jgi:hypothetical protein